MTISYIIVGFTCFMIGRTVEWGQNVKIIKEYEHLADEYHQTVQHAIRELDRLRGIVRHNTTDAQSMMPQRSSTLH